MGPPVFKTGEGSIRPLAGSIPVRLRHTWDSADDSNISDLRTTSYIKPPVPIPVPLTNPTEALQNQAS